MKAQLKADLDLKKATVTDKDLNKAIESRYGYTKNQYEFQVLYNRSKFSSTDPINDLTVEGDTHFGLSTFDINNFWGDFTYFAPPRFARFAS